jgi:hypothetical protein
MTTAPETSETNPLPVAPKQPVTRWHSTEQRVAALHAKKLRRRAAHRVALRRSHANG